MRYAICKLQMVGEECYYYKTVRASIRRLEILKTQEEEGKFNDLTKKEVLELNERWKN